jgi:hypothetical protein
MELIGTRLIKKTRYMGSIRTCLLQEGTLQQNLIQAGGGSMRGFTLECALRESTFHQKEILGLSCLRRKMTHKVSKSTG